jgi:hypothetical protein
MIHAQSGARRLITNIIVLVLFLFVTGCQAVSNPTAIPTPAAVSSIQTDEGHATGSPTAQGETTTAPEIEATQTPDSETTLAQPTPAPTLEDWREAPIEPAISERVVDIYEEGQRQGRDPASFSVIGDCQSIPFVFMGPFSRGELEPDPSESYLWNAINYFDSSFKRWSVTARGGFTAASILNALQADPNECKPGETPLTCEFRLNNPAFVLITLETWLDPDTIDRYEVYLRQILDSVIEKGAVPILLTKADASELRGEKHVINPVIVNLAYEYQVPVVNFWRAAQYLDNYGIDPEREGFHLSQAGYNLKNILALRALYAVWTKVESGESQTTPANDPTPTPTAESADALNPEIVLPDCEGGCVFFGTAQSEDGNVSAKGIYAYQVNNQELVQVLPEGYDLQDASADGDRMLVNNENTLLDIDLGSGEISLISSTFYDLGRQGAYWNADGEIVYLDSEHPLETDHGTAFTLYPSRRSETLYFSSGDCTSKDFCESNGVFMADTEGEITPLSGVRKPVFSPDGSRMAFLNPDAATQENYYHIPYLIEEETDRGIASRRVLYLPDEPGFEVYPEVEAYAFSPDNERLLLLYNVYSEYYEKSLRLQTYLWDLSTGILYNFDKVDGASGSLNPCFAWSPDGEQILFFFTDLAEDGTHHINIYQTDLTTGEKLSLVTEDLFVESDYFYLTNLYWR